MFALNVLVVHSSQCFSQHDLNLLKPSICIDEIIFTCKNVMKLITAVSVKYCLMHGIVSRRVATIVVSSRVVVA